MKTILLILLLGIITSFSSPPTYEIYHETGNGNYVLLTLSRQAFFAHLYNHPNDWVQL